MKTTENNTMENLSKQLELLQTKKTWLRKGLQDWLEKWSENTPEVDGELLYLAPVQDYMAVDTGYYIRPGIPYLYTGYDDSVNYQGIAGLNDREIISEMDIEDVKAVIKALPKRTSDYFNIVKTEIEHIEKLMSTLFNI